MLGLLGSRAISLLSASRALMRGPFGLLDSAARCVLALFDRFSGLHLLADVQEFVQNFDGMYEGFAARAAQAAALLRDRKTVIVIVTTAEPPRIAQACEFIEVLKQRELRIDMVAVNRVMPPLPTAEQIAEAALPSGLKHKLQRCIDEYAGLKRREVGAIDRLRPYLPHGARLVVAPDRTNQPSSLRHLRDLATSVREA
jgi:anion-transporting  ArsA/GET3 family ATPase